MQTEKIEQAYISLLREELVPAQGCTEPIALAFCAAKAREVLGCLPQKLRVHASGNIIKNVKGVIVPGTNGRKGIAAAAIFGAIGGDAGKELEVLSDISPEDRSLAEQYLEQPGYCTVEHLKTDAKLHIIVEAFSGNDSALAEIRDTHTNLIRVERNGVALFKKTCAETLPEEPQTDYDFLSVEGILSFAEHVEISKIENIIERQIRYNTAISNEGLLHTYGANVGKTLLETADGNVWTQARAAAAAGSDARMSGSVLPVVINSGSGNQGITVSMPVVVYAQHLGASRERLIRALAISNLVAIHQKSKVGRLSAYCGAVSAAAGSGAAIAWLDGASHELIELTVSNTLANVSGILCDGAKPSCAAKIASAVEAALVGYSLAKKQRSFQPGDGIVKEGLEETISAVGEIASKGMLQTDEEIIRIMISE